MDADFKTPFETVWKDSITDAENAPTDEQVVDAQANLTDAVEVTLKDCCNYFQSLKYKIEKAFPNQPGIWKEFGYDNYDDARQVPERMIVFMKVFHDVAASTKYKTTLIAAGFSQINIDDILTKRTALVDAKTAQENSQKIADQNTSQKSCGINE